METLMRSKYQLGNSCTHPTRVEPITWACALTENRTCNFPGHGTMLTHWAIPVGSIENFKCFSVSGENYLWTLMRIRAKLRGSWLRGLSNKQKHEGNQNNIWYGRSKIYVRKEGTKTNMFFTEFWQQWCWKPIATKGQKALIPTIY